jgi:carboxypeptidase PM20D1
MRRVLKLVATLLLLLVVVVCVRALLQRSRQVSAPPVTDLAVDAGAAAQRLAGAIRIATISHEEGANVETAAFAELHRYLEASFPRVHAALSREVVAGSSLLYTWKGSDPALPPLLLLAHQDVVPVEAGTEAGWTHPPFSGAIAGGFLWGRGTLDDKEGVLSILEGAELLLARGFQPKRTILFAFGHDEEAGGQKGAKEVAALLERRGVTPLMILDEGGAIGEGLVPGVEKPVALIGIAEKGFTSLELVAEAEGGHSSMPPRHTAVGELAAAIASLEDHPMPARIAGATRSSFEYLAPEMSFAQRALLSNLWLFSPLMKSVFSSQPAADARIRTSTAATMFQAGVKDNVLPFRARAVVNFRILPGDKVADVIRHVRETVGKKIRVRSIGGAGSEPPPEAPLDGDAFRQIQTTVAQVFPGTLTAPNLLAGATDSRHYSHLTPNIYRFHPIRIKEADLVRVHGTNERIGVENYAEVVRFYAQLMREVGE